MLAALKEGTRRLQALQAASAPVLEPAPVSAAVAPAAPSAPAPSASVANMTLSEVPCFSPEELGAAFVEGNYEIAQAWTAALVQIFQSQIAFGTRGCAVLVMRGMPGSGKNFLVAAILEHLRMRLHGIELDAMECSADQHMEGRDGIYNWSREKLMPAHGLALLRGSAFLHEGREEGVAAPAPVAKLLIINNCHISPGTRGIAHAIASFYKCPCFVVEPAVLYGDPRAPAGSPSRIAAEHFMQRGTHNVPLATMVGVATGCQLGIRQLYGNLPAGTTPKMINPLMPRILPAFFGLGCDAARAPTETPTWANLVGGKHITTLFLGSKACNIEELRQQASIIGVNYELPVRYLYVQWKKGVRPGSDWDPADPRHRHHLQYLVLLVDLRHTGLVDPSSELDQAGQSKEYPVKRPAGCAMHITLVAADKNAFAAGMAANTALRTGAGAGTLTEVSTMGVTVRATGQAFYGVEPGNTLLCRMAENLSPESLNTVQEVHPADELPELTWRDGTAVNVMALLLQCCSIKLRRTVRDGPRGTSIVDVKVGGNDDKAYANSRLLRQEVPRGLSFLFSGLSGLLAVWGLPKFSYLSEMPRDLAALLQRTPFTDRVSVRVSEKRNGENAVLSALQLEGVWWLMVGSKAVRAAVPLTDEAAFEDAVAFYERENAESKSYTFALRILRCFRRRHMQGMRIQADLAQLLREHTLVFEYESPDSKHIAHNPLTEDQLVLVGVTRQGDASLLGPLASPDLKMSPRTVRAALEVDGRVLAGESSGAVRFVLESASASGSASASTSGLSILEMLTELQKVILVRPAFVTPGVSEGTVVEVVFEAEGRVHVVTFKMKQLDYMLRRFLRGLMVEVMEGADVEACVARMQAFMQRVANDKSFGRPWGEASARSPEYAAEMARCEHVLRSAGGLPAPMVQALFGDDDEMRSDALALYERVILGVEGVEREVEKRFGSRRGGGESKRSR